MAAGLQCWDANGTKTLEITDRITRVIYTRVLDPNESGYVDLGDFDASRGVAFALPHVGDNNSALMAHQVKYYGNRVEWRAGWSPTRCWSTLTVIMYA